MPLDWSPEQLADEQAAMRDRNAGRVSVITDLTALVERVEHNNGFDELEVDEEYEAVLTANGLEPLDEYLRRTR